MIFVDKGDYTVYVFHPSQATLNSPIKIGNAPRDFEGDYTQNGVFASLDKGIYYPLGDILNNGKWENRGYGKMLKWSGFILHNDGTLEMRPLHDERTDNKQVIFQFTPQLLQDGKDIMTSDRDLTQADILRPALRSAIGFNRHSGEIFMFTTRVIYSLSALRDLMRWYGCTDGGNLDGGGSVATKHDNRWQRPVSSALVVKKKEGGNEVSKVYNVWKNVRITSPYGWRTRNGGEMHHGIDLATFRGDKVPAFHGGKVVFAGMGQSGTGLGNYGITVILEVTWHGIKFYHLYTHLDSVLCKVGDTIKKGQHVGTMGNTGASDAPHLHFEVRRPGASWGWKQTSDPTSHLEMLNINIQTKYTNAIENLPPATVEVHGESFQACIINVDGVDRTFLPLRDVSKALGIKVTWDNSTKTVTVERE